MYRIIGYSCDMKNQPDIAAFLAGCFAAFRPRTREGRRWLVRTLHVKKWQWAGPYLMIDADRLWPIIEQAKANGLRCTCTEGMPKEEFA